MLRKLMILFSSACLLGSTPPLWAAGAPKYRPAESRQVPAIIPVSDPVGPSSSAQPGPRTPTSFVGVGAAASPGAEIGTTYYDYQHNGSCGRQVDQLNGQIQATFMDQDLPQVSPGRRVRWNRISVTGSPVPYLLDNGGSINRLPLGAPWVPGGSSFPEDQAGYSTFQMLPDGRGVAFYHALGVLGSWTAAVDLAVGAGIFSGNTAPQPPPPAGFDGALFAWPHGTVDIVGADTVVHVVATDTTGATDLPFLYWRGVVSGASINWATPVVVDSTSTLSAVVEASPVSDDVAIVYCLPRYLDIQTENDVAYRLSTDGGVSWGPVINTTNYIDTDPDRAYWALGAVYDDDTTLHIVYNTIRATLTESGQYGTYFLPCDLWHWNDKRATHRRIATADWLNSCSEMADHGGMFTLNLGKPNISVKPAGAGPGTGIADELLHAVWVQFGPTDTDCATRDGSGNPGGYVNGEIYLSVSSDDGLSWDRPLNITGTETPNCLPGDCHSEHWVSAAARADSGLYLAYVDDTHAGGIIHGEGEWSSSPYLVYAVATRAAIPGARIRSSETDFVELNVPVGGVDTIEFVIENEGNIALNYQMEVTSDNGGLAHVTVNGMSVYSDSILVGGAPQALYISYDGVGLTDPSEWNWRLELTSNDSTNNPGVGGSAIQIHLNVFVADTWYTRTQDTISTGTHRLAVGSCLALGDKNQIGQGFYNYANTAEWLYEASPLITWLDGGTKRVYRDFFWFDVYDRSRTNNQSYRAQSSISVVRSPVSEVASGIAFTTDSLIQIEYEITAFKDPGLTEGAVMMYTVTNRSGGTFTGLDLGAGLDLDVDPELRANVGMASAAGQFLIVQGGSRDTLGVVTTVDSFAVAFYIPLDGDCEDRAVGGQMLDNQAFIYPFNDRYNTDSLYNIMNRISGWSGATFPADTASDIHPVILHMRDTTLGPDDTLRFAFGIAVSHTDTTTLRRSVEALRQALNPNCPGIVECPPLAGDVNLSSAVDYTDLSELFAYCFGTGPAPVSLPAADLDAYDGVTVRDVAYLDEYLHAGTPTPVCPTTQPEYQPSLRSSDTLSVTSAVVPADGTTFFFRMDLRNSSEMVARGLPLSIDVDGVIPTIDSVVFSAGAQLAFGQRVATVDAGAGMVHIGLTRGVGGLGLAPGKRELLTLHGSIAAAPEVRSVRVDTTRLAGVHSTILVESGSADGFIPVYGGFEGAPINDSLTFILFSPVDMVVTDPNGDSIGIGFNTILNESSYDTLTDYNDDMDDDDIVTIPHPLVGHYDVRIIREDGAPSGSKFTMGIRINGNQLLIPEDYGDADIEDLGVTIPDSYAYTATTTLAGDCNADGVVTAADIIYLVNYVFKGGVPPVVPGHGDVNCDEVDTSADIITLVNYAFKGGDPPCSQTAG